MGKMNRNIFDFDVIDKHQQFQPIMNVLNPYIGHSNITLNGKFCKLTTYSCSETNHIFVVQIKEDVNKEEYWYNSIELSIFENRNDYQNKRHLGGSNRRVIVDGDIHSHLCRVRDFINRENKLELLGICSTS